MKGMLLVDDLRGLTLGAWSLLMEDVDDGADIDDWGREDMDDVGDEDEEEGDLGDNDA